MVHWELGTESVVVIVVLYRLVGHLLEHLEGRLLEYIRHLLRER